MTRHVYPGWNCSLPDPIQSSAHPYVHCTYAARAFNTNQVRRWKGGRPVFSGALETAERHRRAGDAIEGGVTLHDPEVLGRPARLAQAFPSARYEHSSRAPPPRPQPGRCWVCGQRDARLRRNRPTACRPQAPPRNSADRPPEQGLAAARPASTGRLRSAAKRQPTHFGPWRHSPPFALPLRSYYSDMTPIHSISTRAPSARPLAPRALRAGRLSPKNVT